jgi:histidine triad (HIT) family protein
MMIMAGCIFCQIIKGRLPCAKIYEDERVISFLDINPINPGHTLVVPKTHAVTIFDVSEEDLSACAIVSQKIARAILSGTGASGLNFVQNNFRTAGQHVDHIHFHLIPRHPHDHFLSSWPGKPYSPGELDRICDKIKSEI